MRSTIIYCISLIVIIHQAQAINIVDPVEPGKKLGYYGALDVDLSMSKGDTEKSEYSFDALLGHGREHYVSFLNLGYGYGKTNSAVDKDNAFMHLRHIHQTKFDKLAWEAFYQLGQDHQSFIEKRQLIGGGLRECLKPSDSTLFFLGVGLMYEDKEYKSQSTTREMVGNFYLSGKKTWLNKNSLLLIAYVQPRLSDPSVFDSIAKGQFSVPLTSQLNFNFKAAYRHTETPAIGKHRDNSSTVVGISYGF